MALSVYQIRFNYRMQTKNRNNCEKCGTRDKRATRLFIRFELLHLRIAGKIVPNPKRLSKHFTADRMSLL
jgi:hypothetical protein